MEYCKRVNEHVRINGRGSDGYPKLSALIDEALAEREAQVRAEEREKVAGLVDGVEEALSILRSEHSLISLAYATQALVNALSSEGVVQFVKKSREVKQKTIDELSMLVRMLAIALPKDNKIRQQAVGYLTRHGLQGSVLRDDSATYNDNRKG